MNAKMIDTDFQTAALSSMSRAQKLFHRTICLAQQAVDRGEVKPSKYMDATAAGLAAMDKVKTAKDKWTCDETLNAYRKAFEQEIYR